MWMREGINAKERDDVQDPAPDEGDRRPSGADLRVSSMRVFHQSALFHQFAVSICSKTNGTHDRNSNAFHCIAVWICSTSRSSVRDTNSLLFISFNASSILNHLIYYTSVANEMVRFFPALIHFKETERNGIMKMNTHCLGLFENNGMCVSKL